MVGIYGDKILPRLVERTCGMPALDDVRRRAAAPLAGAIVEIGFGSGLNVGCYPETVTSVTAIDPADLAWQRAQDRVRASPIPITRGGLDGQRLEFGDASFDGALSTFTLCTVPDLPAALAELARTVRPGGVLAFAEHGLAPEGGVQRVQRLLNPVERALAGGCELTRDVPAQLVAAGWQVQHLERFYLKQTPKPWGALSLGWARRG